MKNHKLAILIGIIFFIVPFFWLKLGEMNLGGDAGRLYFYDPLSFLKNYALYNFISSGKGSESGGFVFFPFTFTLYLLKFIFPSPTTLIAIFNGIILSVSFLSIYFIVRELLKAEKSILKERFINACSLIAGLFYIFSQELMNAGWETPILTHNQIFLNPFMFLLIFKYLLTKNYFYIIGACILSVVFSTNFSYIGSPTFFAFYPLSLLFLWSYIKFVRKMTIPYKGLVIGLVLFVCLHAFHLIPEVLDVFSLNSANNKTVFATGGQSSRGGFDYFIAIAAGTKVSLAWLGVAQFQNDPEYIIFILFPFVLLGGFFFNKGKTLLVTGIFFLVVLFFATANITDIGFTFYKLLFKIPGFSMFRNFHGQWSYVFIFFYTLLFGQALAIIAQNVKVRVGHFFIGSFFLILVASGIPLLNGSIPIPRHKDSGLRFAFRMDLVYEKVLDFFKRDPVDSKILSLPLTGPSYQVLQGADGNGSLYMGLPTISYLVGKSDFAGFGSFDPYSDLFLNYMNERNFDGIERILSIMNIHQVFYNSDPFIYGKPLQGFLYAHVSGYTPRNQNEYKSFIENLSNNDPFNFGDKYHVYTLDSNKFLPHVFTTTDVFYTNNQVDFSTDLSFNKNLRAVPVSIVDKVNKDSSLLFGSPSTFLSKLTGNTHFHKRDTFIKVSLDDPRYPFIVLKEKFELYRARNNYVDYLDLKLLFLSKRISELNVSGQYLPMYESWKEPEIWEIYKRDAYKSWEANLARYQKGTEELIDWVSSRNDSDVLKKADMVIINEQLFNHQLSLLRSLKIMNRKNSEKKYLVSLTNAMFEKVFQKINVPIYNSSQYYYVLPGHPGDYSVYVEQGDTGIDLTTASISINKGVLKPLRNAGETISSNSVVQFDNYSLTTKDTKLTLNILPNNLAKNAKWNNSSFAVETDKIQILTVDNTFAEDTRDLKLEIPNIEEKETYLVSFDYLTDGDDFIFSFFDKLKADDDIRTNRYYMYFEKILNSKTWKFHQSIITTHKDSSGALLRLSSFSGKESSKIYMKNLSVTKIQYPKLVFLKHNYQVVNTAPKITFTKINPTKYSVKVEGAKDPYALVFLESFNNNWSLIDTSINDKSFARSLLRFTGFLSKNLVSVFIKDDLEPEARGVSYFNGDVKEANHKNIFLSPSTFETWGKRYVAQNTHSETFGYANVWLINPEDMQGRSGYTLILEMKNQKRFYIFGFISTITLVMILIYYIKKGFLILQKNNK